MSSILKIPTQEIITPLFTFRFGRDDGELKASIQEHGLLNPPKLLRSHNQLSIIDGTARIEAARDCGIDPINCFVFDHDHLDKKAAFLLCLEANGWDRDLNLVEKAHVLMTAQSLFGEEGIPQEVFHGLQIKRTATTLKHYGDLLRLPVVVQRYATDRSIALSVVLGFLRFTSADVEKLASLLFQLPINQNKLLEILDLLYDISKRDDTSASSLLTEVLEGVKQESHPHKKEQLLRAALQAKKNPLYDTQLSEFKGKVRKLSNRQNTKISPAPYFEDDYIDIQSRLSSQKDLKELIQTLNNEEWFNLLNK